MDFNCFVVFFLSFICSISNGVLFVYPTDLCCFRVSRSIECLFNHFFGSFYVSPIPKCIVPRLSLVDGGDSGDGGDGRGGVISGKFE